MMDRLILHYKKTTLLFIILISFLLFSPKSLHAADWPMAGANPGRTNWTSTEVPLNSATLWVKPITPYISQHVQVIGAEGKVFVSTAQGLYAFDANTGADAWKYATALPLGHSPTYSNGFLYVGGMDRKIHKVSASNGNPVWTFTADGGFSSNPIVVNGRVYATNRDGALYAINDTATPTLAWKFQTGNQILQSPAFKAEDDGIASTTQGTIYIASNDGYGYAVNAQTGSQVWQSDADPTTPQKDKFPNSRGFYAWWPVIYGQDVVFTRRGYWGGNGAEAFWLYCPVGSTMDSCSSVTANVNPGTLGNEPGNWASGEKTLDLRTNPNGNTFADYFENPLQSDTRQVHGQHLRNAYFINRTTGLERQFDIDGDGRVDAAPISWVGDNGIHDPPIVVGNATATDSDDVIYFHTNNRSRGSSFNNANISGWKVGTPFLSLPASYVRSSDEPTGLSASGSKIYYNHCCDRAVGALDVSIPNSTYPNTNNTREKLYINSAGLNWFAWPTDTTGLPVTPNNYYFKEASKYFWDPRPSTYPPNPGPPCCAAVFWNENDKVGPSAYDGKLYVILGNALVAIGQGGAGTTAPVLSSAPAVSPSNNASSVTDTQLRDKLEQEVSEIVAAGHLLPSIGEGLGHHSGRYEDDLEHYWHNPADLHLTLIRALPYLSVNLQNQVKTYLQNEFVNFPPSSCSHIGFTGEKCNLSGNVQSTQRDPYPYPPIETQRRLFDTPTIRPKQGSSFVGWSFPPINAYALWKYAQTPGLCVAPTCTPQILLNQLGNRLKAPIDLTDEYLEAFPNVHNAYISGYIGYIELAKLAGQTTVQYAEYTAELNRLKTLRTQNLKTFPDTQQNFDVCDNECYFESMINYFNFAYMTRELGDFLNTSARSSDPNKDILAILQKHQDIAPYWMIAHNGETQGEFAVMPYHQNHSLFQALAMVKNAPRDELLKYLDAPIVPVGDLYYIDNLVAVLESSNAGTPSPGGIPGDADGDGEVDGVDYIIWFNHYNQSTRNGPRDGDFNTSGFVDGLDYVIWLNNYTS